MKTALTFIAAALVLAGAALLATSARADSYWQPDKLHFATEVTRVSPDPNVAKWCGAGRLGCIHRNQVYYEWDYHLTGNKRPSECVIIVSDRLAGAQLAEVVEHERCHCKGFHHYGDPHARSVACPK